MCRQLIQFIAMVFLAGTIPGAEQTPRPLLIGLDADLSGTSAQAGEAIRRGALLAIDEVNARGGALGRQLELVTRNHRGNPARALVNIGELADMPDLVAVLGGLHTPAALEVLPLVHERTLPFLIPWAAGTAIVENGRSPNYVFRVSVRDADAGEFLVDSAMAAGHRNLGLLLECTGWGRSNHASMQAAALTRGLPAPPTQWFNWGVRDLSPQIAALQSAGIEAILLVANPPEALTAIKAVAALPAEKRPSIVSHWGITGGTFASQAGPDLSQVDLRFLQTFTVAEPQRPAQAAALVAAYLRRFPDITDPRDIPAAPGVAHAYDLVHLLAAAIIQAGTSERAAIRDALEHLGPQAGVMSDYNPAFTGTRHDALGPDVFVLARYDAQGRVVPFPRGVPKP
jgi:branched-chain amino acid transport system substrate-binding protein